MTESMLKLQGGIDSSKFDDEIDATFDKISENKYITQTQHKKISKQIHCNTSVHVSK